MGSLLLSPGSWCAQGFLVPSKSLFPQSCGSSVIRSHWPSKSNSLGFLSPFAGSPGLKVAVDPRTFTKVQELLWCNCSAVCGSSAQQLCSGADGNPLQKDFCCMPRLPGLLQPEPLSLWQTTADPCLRSRRWNPQRPTADPCLRSRCWNTQRRVWLSLLRGGCSFPVDLVHTRFLTPETAV